MKTILFILFAGALWSQEPIVAGQDSQSGEPNPLAGIARPSSQVQTQPVAQVCIGSVCVTMTSEFTTALERDRVDTLLPRLQKDGTVLLAPLNADKIHHLMYLLLQDGGTLGTLIRRYPPASVQAGIDAANTAARSLGQTIQAARDANQTGK